MRTVLACGIVSALFALSSGSIPTVVNTWRGTFGHATSAAWSELVAGASAVDAVVRGATQCEVEQCHRTVGYGGSPDERGETTLDAMIIDGTTMEIGSVGGIRNVRDAIRSANLVKTHTGHTVLVGEQAGEFAVSMGCTYFDLTTQESAELNRDWQGSGCQPNFRRHVWPDPAEACGPYSLGKSAPEAGGSEGAAALTADNASKPKDVGLTDTAAATAHDPLLRPSRRCGVGWAGPETHDTIAMLAVDASGQVAAGTSTNGNCAKVPGRVGDAAIPGAGAYARTGVGACGATGDGDVMMRFLPCYQAVENMQQGMSPDEAAEDAMRRIMRYYPGVQGALVTMNSTGAHGGAGHGWTFHYTVISEETGGKPVVMSRPSLKAQ